MMNCNIFQRLKIKNNIEKENFRVINLPFLNKYFVMKNQMLKVEH
jgi:hypothetical protein